MPALIEIATLKYIREVPDGTICKQSYKVVPLIIASTPEYNKLTQCLEEDLIVTIDGVIKSLNVINLPPQDAEKNTKTNFFNEGIQAGYTIPGMGITLGLYDDDRIAFNQIISLTQLALDVGVMQISDNVTIADKDGKSYQVTVLQLKQIMLGYGAYYNYLWQQKVS